MKRTLARLILILSVIAWAIIVVSVLVTPVNADAAPIEEPKEDDGRIHGDDVPATERCYMTDEEVQEDFENEYITDALLSRATVIDGCTITFYCNEKYPHICGTGDGIAADGTPALAWATCAVDPDVIPLGSTIMVDLGDGYGLRTLVANDTGGAVKGNHIDLCVGSHEEALQLGRRTATVYWCKE